MAEIINGKFKSTLICEFQNKRGIHCTKPSTSGSYFCKRHNYLLKNKIPISVPGSTIDTIPTEANKYAEESKETNLTNPHSRIDKLPKIARDALKMKAEDIDLEELGKQLTQEEYYIFLGERRKLDLEMMDISDDSSHESKPKKQIKGKRKLRKGYKEIKEDEWLNMKKEILTTRMYYMSLYSAFADEKRKNAIRDQQLAIAKSYITDNLALGLISKCEYMDTPLICFPKETPFTYIKLNRIDDDDDLDNNENEKKLNQVIPKEVALPPIIEEREEMSDNEENKFKDDIH